MHTDDNLKDFDALEVELQGSNLIEASAGTGKTYSIAILVLRLLLEKDFSLKEILMVTFTKAAVAELEERVRLFVRTAYHISQGESATDSTIEQIVHRAMRQQDGTQKVEKALKEAITFLDETSVLTIHSFCQQMLSEFAFETNQPFGAELLLDSEALIEAQVNKFWRKQITGLPLAVLSRLQIKKNDLTRKGLQELVKNALAGKALFSFDPSLDYNLDADFCDHVINGPQNLQEDIETCYANLKERLFTEKEEIIQNCHKNATASKTLLPLLDNPDAFLELVIEKRSTQYVQKILAGMLDELDRLLKLKKELATSTRENLNYVHAAAIQQVSKQIKAYKAQHNQLAFDDLIDQLHQALQGPNSAQLITALREKYKAVFIDEFQDTDRQQYEIFKTALEAETVVFYIGDPKQSIYGWRKADIDTYLKASKEVDAAYGMNINFRSSSAYIAAMNSFFLPREDFDTFYFESQEQKAFSYRIVDAPKGNKKGEMTLNGQTVAPLSIASYSNSAENLTAMISQIIDLLDNTGYRIGPSEQMPGRRITPSDIGILVRSNKEAHQIKTGLSRFGIPSIVIGDAKVLDAPEAVEVFYLLDAMLTLTRASISRALLSSFTGFDTITIQRLSDEKTVERFKKYNAEWERDGIYKAMFSFLTDFGVQQRLLARPIDNGERKLTNLFQLIELLYKNQTLKSLSPIELVDWLKRGIENKGAVGDEYEQRIESDEESITIMTIHKSKGLQFNIVLSPSLDFIAGSKIDFYQFRAPDRGYVMAKASTATEEQKKIYNQQSAQENRRLLYVALTRAVYKCFIFRTNFRQNSSTLKPFLDAQKDATNPLIEMATTVEIPAHYQFKKNKNIQVDTKRMLAPVNFDLQEINWSRLSYTYLAAKSERLSRKLATGDQQGYDHFVFQQLAKGNMTGNMLHYIFEKIHFTMDEKWPSIIHEAVMRFSPAASAAYEPMLLNLIKEVLQAKINTGSSSFELADLQHKHRLHELEFDFPVAEWSPRILETAPVFEDTIRLAGWQKLAGMMNGKIDMLFEHEDRYYLLDWKSTFLGEDLESYGPSQLEEAMTVHNYHLQYLIYTVAAKKYLESRLGAFDYDRDFGGVLYFFLRGVRKNKETGIFHAKPKRKQIEFLEKIFTGQLV